MPFPPGGIELTYAQFVTDLPEFTDATRYPESSFNFWLNWASLMLNAERFGAVLTLAGELFVAHNLALEARALLEASNGGIPGSTIGPVSSKSVGGVSVSYATNATLDPRAQHWNMTIYGIRLWRLLRFAGAAPVQVNGPFVSPAFNGPPWTGPITSIQ